MQTFHTLDEFLVLPDSYYQPEREFFQHKTGREWLELYSQAKTAWEKYGDEGPPVGTDLFYYHHKSRVIMGGTYDRDPRFFEVKYMMGRTTRTALVEKALWWRSVRDWNPENDWR